ncbi:hypothetical protein TNCT_12871 [Trichonephila clavata]|uniref:Uncharacterized protein n=1 Tax=Trichonephila clavata TaxID=2740835 RepID=A0A8X6HQJ1_TRICU|nr:hypothetical protein TNCT_12871 [Trichonephila clavata]
MISLYPPNQGSILRLILVCPPRNWHHLSECLCRAIDHIIFSRQQLAYELSRDQYPTIAWRLTKIGSAGMSVEAKRYAEYIVGE